MKQSWIWGMVVCGVLLFVGLYPQLHLYYQRGADYNGIYAFNDLDETAYAAYLQALIDGRPRRNNPFTGDDGDSAKPLPESLFSIQFLAPSAAAIAARSFNLNSSESFILIAALCALAAAAMIYKLNLTLTGDARFAAAATLAVLCGGVLIIGEGAIGEIVRGSTAYPYFPFLRRYVPAIPFPIFWLLCLAVWQSIHGDSLKIKFLWSAAAVLSFGFLVYSYFYLWTTAAAWLSCLAAVWLIFRPAGWRREITALLLTGAAIFSLLAPYAFMLANRDAAMDDVQLLVQTRMPDLLRRLEILGFVNLILLGGGFWRRILSPQNKLALFNLSLSLVPFVVFNQQILTNRVLQPIHYEVFIVNYVALFSFCLTLFLLWRGTKTNLPPSARWILPLLITLAGSWGIVEAVYTTAVVSEANVIRDQAKPVSEKLREISQTDFEEARRTIILPFDLLQGDDQPSIAPQSVLWARHQHVFAGETNAENKLRFYHFLYFSGFTKAILAEQLRQKNVIMVITLFGWDKLTSRLSSAAKELTDDEIEQEAARFGLFCENFDLEQARDLKLAYVVAPRRTEFNYPNLERWYERDQGEQFGEYFLYRVKLREEQSGN